MFTKRAKLPVMAVLILLLCGALFALLPPVQNRLEVWAADLQYQLNPPEEVVFVPQTAVEDIHAAVTQTLQALREHTPTATETPPQPPAGPTPTPTATPIPTQTPTPLPAAFQLTGFTYQHQHGLWNYCGPATLATNLSFWGWQIDRLDVGEFLRGSRQRVDDKNTMPYEMETYVETQTGLRLLVRTGGNLELLKALIAAGFPPIVEKDDLLDGIGWLGHYLLLSGYDEAAQEFISLDAYHGEDTPYAYETLLNSWRAFNYTFLISFPPEREADLLHILGPYADEAWAANRALEIANEETLTQTGLAQYFAWFNRGSSLVALQDYAGAAQAFDIAFGLYSELPAEERPWRMLWYQTGPYWAYYYTGRYYDVIALADQTLDSMKEPILEESYYWRALAKEALGDIPGAIEDLQTSIELNPNFSPGISQLQRIQGGG